MIGRINQRQHDRENKRLVQEIQSLELSPFVLYNRARCELEQVRRSVARLERDIDRMNHELDLWRDRAVSAESQLARLRWTLRNERASEGKGD